MGLSTLLAVIAMTLAAWFTQAGNVMLIAMLCGAAGSVVNSYYRLARLSGVDKAALSEVEEGVLIAQIYVSLLISSMLAMVMYGLCFSDLLAGQLFPKFSGARTSYQANESNGLGPLAAFLDINPTSNIDTMKVLIWSFIAGYSERLVPNVLDRLASEAQGASRQTNPGPDPKPGSAALDEPSTEGLENGSEESSGIENKREKK